MRLSFFLIKNWVLLFLYEDKAVALRTSVHTTLIAYAFDFNCFQLHSIAPLILIRILIQILIRILILIHIRIPIRVGDAWKKTTKNQKYFFEKIWPPVFQQIGQENAVISVKTLTFSNFSLENGREKTKNPDVLRRGFCLSHLIQSPHPKKRGDFLCPIA